MMSITQAYEPKHFQDLIFADPAAQNMCNGYVQGWSCLAKDPLLLYGPPGSGKTVAARVIAADRLGLSDTDQVLEYNGCDLSTDDFSTLSNAAAMSRITLGREILIINELDEMNRATQGAFRSWWEKHRSIELIATTNEPLGRLNAPTKLLPAIVSRFECVKLGAPSLRDILPRVTDIFKAEGVPITPAQLKALLGTYNGDLRDAMRTVNRAIMQSQMGATKPSVAPLHATP